MLFLDFKKAFDTVEWDFMIKVLQKFGFKNDFITWVKLLYNNICSSVMNNGWQSNFFKISRGIRQGCPLSALLFIIVAEILANNIRACDDLHGITVVTNDTVHHLKITQLADDTTLFLKDKTEINVAIGIIEEFGQFSGLRLNKTKTEGILIGKLKTSNEVRINGITFSSKVKALGTYFGTDKQECENLNWSDKLESCKKLINSWQQRNLTMFGKVTIVKSLILPKLSFLIQTIPIANNIIKQLNSMIFNFVWGNKAEKIKRTTLIGNRLEGGLEIPDIDIYSKTLKLKWLKSLCSNDNANWKIIPNFFLSQYGDNCLILQMNLDSLKSLPNIKYNIPTFYKDVLRYFFELNNLHVTPKPQTFYDIRTQIIWGNRFIKYKGKCLVFNSWINSGLLFINDVIDDNGEIKETVLNKLVVKTNWISEISKLHLSIPNTWKRTLSSEASSKSYVKTDIRASDFGKNCNIGKLNNRELKLKFIANKFESPYMHQFWEKTFKQEIQWYSVYFVIKNTLVDNRVKQLKFKLIHKIVPSNENLYKWKQIETPFCKHCNEIETLEHFFIQCSYITAFWDIIHTLFKQQGICKNISMFEVVIGYKTQYRQYQDINIILGQIIYTIYKSYMIGERRTKNTNMLKILYNDLLTLEKYFDKIKVSHPTINSFNKILRGCFPR